LSSRPERPGFPISQCYNHVCESPQREAHVLINVATLKRIRGSEAEGSAVPLRCLGSVFSTERGAVEELAVLVA
jgi:hypothetical protein